MKHETLGEQGKINVTNVKIKLTYDKSLCFSVLCKTICSRN